MSNVYWRTKKQQEQFALGRNLTERISEYLRVWKSRCYFEDIPDEVTKKLMQAKRAPSYKAIAVAILKNDHNLYSLGFGQRDSKILTAILDEKRKSKQEKHPELF